MPTENRSSSRHLLLVALSILLFVAAGFAAGPVVNKVDPPNWWAGLDPSPMLLLSGQGLGSATVTTQYPGVRITRVQPGADDHYLFVFLDTKGAKAGKARFEIATPQGKTTIEFPILAKPSPQGRYQGISPDDVIYLIMPDRFADGDPSNDQPAASTGTYDRKQPQAWHGGDLKGIIEHLPYLHDLGVTALWLTPVWQNTDNSYHGYHVVNFYNIDPHMGTVADYQALVTAAHKLGMKVIFDYVVNHTGPKDAWATDPPTKTWLHGTPQNHIPASYDFGGIIDPHAPPAFSRATIDGWFVNELPDLNPDDPLLHQYLLDNAIWWTETSGLDAFRLDTFPYSPRRFWSTWLPEVNHVFPKLTTIGEVSDPDPAVTSFFAGGEKRFDGVDTHVSTVFDFPLYYTMADVTFNNKPVAELVHLLERDWLYPHPERLVTFIGNHDKPRFMSAPGATPEKLETAFGLLLTMRGIPEIYAGDEIGMQGGDDPDNRRDFPGGFPGDAQNAFTTAGRTSEQQEIFAYVQSLLTFRKTHSALRDGAMTHVGFDDHAYVFLRADKRERLLVVYNNAGARRLQLPVSATPAADAHELKLLFGEGKASLTPGGIAFDLSPGVAIYSVR